MTTNYSKTIPGDNLSKPTNANNRDSLMVNEKNNNISFSSYVKSKKNSEQKTTDETLFKQATTHKEPIIYNNKIIDRQKNTPVESIQRKIKNIIEEAPKKRSPFFSLSSFDEIEARIAGHMALIKKYIISRIGIHNNLCVILGGSYGRGEGGFVKVGMYERPFNDYDFFVFVQNSSYMGRKLLCQKFKKASKVLSQELGILVDFSIPFDINSLSSFPATLRWFDLKYGYKILIGSTEVIRALPYYAANRLPIQEGMQLMVNRGVGLLQAKVLLRRDKKNTLKILMHINKVFLALGDTFLIVKGTYHKNLEVRKKILKLYATHIELAEKIYPYYSQAISFRINPRVENIEAQLDQLYLKAAAAYKIMYLQLFSLYYDKPIKNFKNFISIIKKNPVSDYRGKSKLKNFIINISFFGISTIKNLWVTAYPANRLYVLLPYFLFKDVREFYSSKEISEILCSNCSASPISSLLKKYNLFLKIWTRFN